MENKASEQITYEKLFRALGDEHRLHILRLLAEREMNARALLAAENIVQSTLSHHMKTLQEGGLVSVRREGKWAYYTLNTEALESAEKYLSSIREGAAVPAGNTGEMKKEEQLPDAGKAAGGEADEAAGEEDAGEKKISLYPRLNADSGKSAGKGRGRQKKKAEKGTKAKEAKVKETGEKQDKAKDRKKDKKKKHGKK